MGTGSEMVAPFEDARLLFRGRAEIRWDCRDLNVIRARSGSRKVQADFADNGQRARREPHAKLIQQAAEEK